MKKIIIIVILFCLSSLLYKTEAITPEFSNYFVEFQKDLKKYNSSWDSTFISNFYLKHNPQFGCNDSDLKDFLNSLEVFIDLVNTEKDEICSLSQQNDYSTRDASDSIRWKLEKQRYPSGDHFYRLKRINALEDSESYTNFYLDFTQDIMPEFDEAAKLYQEALSTGDLVSSNDDKSLSTKWGYVKWTSRKYGEMWGNFSHCRLSLERFKKSIHYIFTPSKGRTILTREDVKNNMKKYNLENHDMFKCIIDNSVTQIEAEAFSFFSVTDVVFPSSLEILGKESFYHCKKLQTLSFPSNSSLKSIGDSCFKYTLITEVNFPASLEKIGDYAFDSCSILQRITFPSNSGLKSIGASCFRYTSISEVSFPASLEQINSNAFYSCKSLQRITFPSNSKLKSIGDHCFNSTFLISEVSFPASLEQINSSAFYSCKNLQRITFPTNSNLKSIGEYCFNSTLITEVNFPASLDNLGRYSFGDCSKLKTITFPSNSNLKSIGWGCFIRTSISEVSFPASLEKIDAVAFKFCSNLHTITFPSNSNLKSIGHFCFEGSAVKEVTFPQNINSIGCCTFSCLEKLTFKSSQPPSFESFYISDVLDTYNVYYCINGKSNDNSITINDNVLLTVKVPKGSKTKYKNDLKIYMKGKRYRPIYWYDGELRDYEAYYVNTDYTKSLKIIEY